MAYASDLGQEAPPNPRAQVPRVADQPLSLVLDALQNNPRVRAAAQTKNKRAILAALSAEGLPTTISGWTIEDDGLHKVSSLSKREKIITWAIAGYLGAAAAGAALGAGGGAATGSGAGTGAGGGVLAPGATGVGAGAGPLATGVGGTGSTVGAVGGGGGTALTADRLLRAAGAGLTGVGLLTSPGGPFGSASKIPPELQGLIDLQAKRLEDQGPLYEAVSQLAFNRLPTSATQGLTAPSYQTTAAGVPPSVPDANTPPGLQRLLRQQQIRMQMQDPIYQAMQRLAQSRLPNSGVT